MPGVHRPKLIFTDGVGKNKAKALGETTDFTFKASSTSGQPPDMALADVIFQSK